MYEDFLDDPDFEQELQDRLAKILARCREQKILPMGIIGYSPGWKGERLFTVGGSINDALNAMDSIRVADSVGEFVKADPETGRAPGE